ncbi:MAG TPA: DUF1802 family protein [Verrucomicrobiales bacterium]|nr:DUF1802 family protein [Verrucomicrobiales bacterium]
MPSSTAPGPLPALAYKEWSPVAEALRTGRQHLLLRKGGIAEGRDAFSFRHPAFWLFPTAFHSTPGALRWFPGPDWSDPVDSENRELRLRILCAVTGRALLSQWEHVAPLAPYHVYGEELLRERFTQGEAEELHLATVRVFFMPSPWVLPYEKRFGGCRSWIELPSPPAILGAAFCPSVSEDQAESVLEEIAALVPLERC